jgi:transcriptional regulator with XRE-family HTH domain
LSEERQPTTLAERVNFLFNKIRHPSGREYSNAELARFVESEIKSSCTRSYISKIRNGHEMRGLSYAKIQAIADFFQVSPAVLFNNDENIQHIVEQVDLYAELLQGDIRIRAMREISHMDRQDLRAVLALVRKIKDQASEK